MELLPATVIKQFPFSTQIRLLRVQEKINSENNSRLSEQTEHILFLKEEDTESNRFAKYRKNTSRMQERVIVGDRG